MISENSKSQSQGPQLPSSTKDSPENDKSNRPVNIMFDRRIHRGNTYAQSTFPTTAARDGIEAQLEIERRKRAAQRRTKTAAAASPTGISQAGCYFDSLGDDAVMAQGRVTCEVQTELYLEELGAIPIEAQAGTQTDAFIDRAQTPLYVPPRRGVDVTTQIVDGELFDFGRAVAPIVDVLIGRVLERSVAELREETELALLRKRQREYAARRAAERAEVARLAAQEQRLRDERARRMSQGLALRSSRDEATKRLAAVAFASSYLAKLSSLTMTALEADGVLAHTSQREVISLFLPLLLGRVNTRLEQISLTRALVDEIVKDAINRPCQA